MDPGSQREESLRTVRPQAIVKFSVAPAHGWQSPAGTGEGVAVVPASAKAGYSQASPSAALAETPLWTISTMTSTGTSVKPQRSRPQKARK